MKSLRNVLFYLNEDVLLEILGYLTLSDTVCFDYAMVNGPDYHYVLGLLRKGKWEISKSQFHDDDVFHDLAILEWLNSRHIPVVKFSSPFNCYDHDLKRLAASDPMLTSVEIEGGRNITDHGLEVFSRSCLTHLSYLKVLDLSGCNELTDDTMRGMHCPLLTSLVLRRCCDITNEGLRFISEGCPSLMFLDLGYCNHIDDSGLAFLSRCRSLRHLDMVLCRAVSDIGLMHLSQGCTLLERLILASCFDISSIGMMYLARGCPSLVHLHVGGCDITDEGLLHLSQGCTALQFLNLQSCRKVTQQGIQYLQNCPAMIELNTIGCCQPLHMEDFFW